MRQVLVTVPFPQNLMDKIQAVSTQVSVDYLAPVDRKWPEGKTTQAEIVYAMSAIPAPHLAPNLRWMQSHSAGVDHLMNTPIWDTDILVTSASGIHAPNMAQYAMTQILSYAHRVPNWFHYQRQAEWPSDRWNKFVPTELRGKTVGILGYGSIGRELARLAKAFGMKVLVTKRDARSTQDTGYTVPGLGDPEGNLPDRIYPSEATRSMVAECDYVVVTLPLTDKTQHLFDEAMFREMKPDSFLINVGRGGVIKETDLVKALKKGWIGGAGLDVFEEEPLPSDSPLWQLENVILTPHTSGFTPHYDERAVDLFTENLRRYLAGEPLLNLVDREAGY